MDYTVHGILQARILEWVAFLFSRGNLPSSGIEPRSPHCRRILYQLSHLQYRRPEFEPWVGEIPLENGYPLQYSGLENSMDRIVHGVTESDTTEQLKKKISVYWRLFG